MSISLEREVDSASLAATPPSARPWNPWLAAVWAPLLLGPVWVNSVGRLAPEHLLGTFAGLVLLLLLGTCSYTDLRWHRIPNWATYTALGWGLLINAWGSLFVPSDQWLPIGLFAPGGSAESGRHLLGVVGLGECLGGAAVAFGAMLVIHSMSGGGAGDVKLAAAIGSIVGIRLALVALMASVIVAGLAAFAMAVWRRGPRLVLGSLIKGIGSKLLPDWVPLPTDNEEELLRSPVPLALYFAIGTLIAVSEVVI